MSLKEHLLSIPSYSKYRENRSKGVMTHFIPDKSGTETDPFRDAAIILNASVFNYTDKYKFSNGYFREGLLFSKVVLFG